MTTRTAKFFKLRAVLDDQPFDLPSIDWAKLLARYSKREFAKRKILHSGVEYGYTVHPTGSTHLLIQRLRATSDSMTQVHDETGELSEHPSTVDGFRYYDSGMTVFMPGLPVFGHVTTGNVVTHAAVTRWLNDFQPFSVSGRLLFTADPVVTQPALEKMQDAFGARRVSLRVPLAKLGSSPGESGLLKTLKGLRGSLTNGSIDITISAGRGKPQHSDALALMALAEDLTQLSGEGLSAEASIVHEVPSKAKTKSKNAAENTKLASEVIDLVKYTIAKDFTLNEGDDASMIDRTFHALDSITKSQRAVIIRSTGGGDETLRTDT